MPVDQSVDFSDTLSSLDTSENQVSQQPDGGSIIPKTGTDDSKAIDSKKANTPEKETNNLIPDSERLKVENEKLRKGQSTLEKRIDTLRQLLGRRREDSQSSISETKPALYKDETGALYTVDPKTGQMVPYGTSSAPTNEFDSKDTKIAEYELKDGVRSVLDEYPNLSISSISLI